MEKNDESPVPQNTDLRTVLSDSFKELSETFSAFIKAPRALWGVNIPYVIEGLVYFGILTILGKFASENVHLSDPQAGWVYSAVTGGITFAMLVLGGVSDKLGVRFSLALSLGIMFVGRILISISGSLPLGTGIGSGMFFVLSAGLLLMVAGYGFYQPAAYAGVKRYTTPKTAAMGYAVVYGLMNFGAFFSGFVSPLTRHHFKKVYPPNGLTAVFWLYAILTLLSTIITIIVLSKKADRDAVARLANKSSDVEGADAESNDETKKSKKEKVRINNWPLIIYSVMATLSLLLVIFVEAGTIAFNPYVAYLLLILFFVIALWEFLRHRPDHAFRDTKFVFFIFILIPVQTLFAHNWLTIPYYLDRAFAGTMVSRYFELFSNINPILIFFLAPIVAGLTAKANVYKMMIYGTFVMAIPTFLLSLGPNIYLFLTFILFMSLGEAMWQPRFLQWIAEIAPEGKTGAYMGIGQFPWFLTKVITGLYSGIFVSKYLPKPASGLPIQSGKMWFIYGVIAMASPIALVIAKRWMMKGMTNHATGSK